MTTVVGGQFMVTAPLPPRSGILLNASPSSSAPNSPKRHHYLSPGFPNAGTAGTHQTPISSHSSASSSASSTDDIVSSTSATSAAATHASSSSETARQSRRKIRFAPLPECQHDYDDDNMDEDLLSPGFFAGFDSATSSPNVSAQALLSPPILPNVRPATPLRSPNTNESHAQASCSTSTLGLSLDGAELPESGQTTETNTVVGTECGTDETHTPSNMKRRTGWSRLLHLPKPSSINSGRPRTPDEHGQFTLCRSPSRESCASGYSFRTYGLRSLFGSLSDNNASSSSLGNPLARRKTHDGSDSVPVSPTVSLRSGLSLKPTVSEAGTSATPAPRRKGHAQTGSGPATVRRGTRLLNGRIYGRRPNTASGPPKNPFANVLDVEEFVEWGHGGMGSVRTAGLGSSRWARLQSNKKLSVGYDDGTVAEDEYDGSGMAWVKKRREAREKKEREEREAREKAEGEKAGGDEKEEKIEDVEVTDEAVKAKLERTPSRTSKTGAESSMKEVGKPLTPIETNKQEVRDSQTSGDKQSVDEKAKDGKDKKEREHVYAAVTVPAPRPLYHAHSRHNSLSSSLTTPQRSAPHTPTVLTPSIEVPKVLVSDSPLGTPSASTAALGLSPLGRDAVHADESSTPSSSASSSYEEESPLGERDDDKDEVDEEEEEELNEQARKTAIGAGVEKVSRHKD